MPGAPSSFLNKLMFCLHAETQVEAASVNAFSMQALFLSPTRELAEQSQKVRSKESGKSWSFETLNNTRALELSIRISCCRSFVQESRRHEFKHLSELAKHDRVACP